jgi:4-amino-4-deoxy-L-arabinose transferase-like glycosyltransferase
VAVLTYLALATIVVHLLIGGRYGFHRDELATLDDARHLAWGYVAYPPLTPFFARVSLLLFGTSLAGFRLFAAVAQALVVLVTGLMAREIGARRETQLVAAMAAVPFCLPAGALMQYVSFDNLFWVLTAYFVVRLLQSENPRWWVAIGASIGLGMMTKYSILFLVAGLGAGILLTDARRYLKSKWLWCGVALSLLIFLPNLLWQVQHGFVSLDFLHHIHARDVRIGRTQGFLPDQVKFTQFALPLALAGLYFCLFTRDGKRWRVLGWMYVVPLLLFITAKGRGYYLVAAYPMLYAAGSVWGEQRLQSLPGPRARMVRRQAWIFLVADVVVTSALTLPIPPIGSTWFNVVEAVNGDVREEIGWEDLVGTVAQIRDSLTVQDRARLGILAGNYGEAGAVNLYGPRYGLPGAISGINSSWQRGYGDPPPQTLIVVGMSRGFVERNFETCKLAAISWNRYGVRNEETRDHPEIFVCRDLRRSWPEFWREFRYYG